MNLFILSFYSKVTLLPLFIPIIIVSSTTGLCHLNIKMKWKGLKSHHFSSSTPMGLKPIENYHTWPSVWPTSMLIYSASSSVLCLLRGLVVTFPVTAATSDSIATLKLAKIGRDNFVILKYLSRHVLITRTQTQCCFVFLKNDYQWHWFISQHILAKISK